MIGGIEIRREELRAICHSFHARWLNLFGSAARGDFEAERR
jgi:hypothetical protein